jgi:hypothetical protein
MRELLWGWGLPPPSLSIRRRLDRIFEVQLMVRNVTFRLRMQYGSKRYTNQTIHSSRHDPTERYVITEAAIVVCTYILDVFTVKALRIDSNMKVTWMKRTRLVFHITRSATVNEYIVALNNTIFAKA